MSFSKVHWRPKARSRQEKLRSCHGQTPQECLSPPLPTPAALIARWPSKPRLGCLPPIHRRRGCLQIGPRSVRAPPVEIQARPRPPGLPPCTLLTPLTPRRLTGHSWPGYGAPARMISGRAVGSGVGGARDHPGPGPKAGDEGGSYRGRTSWRPGLLFCLPLSYLPQVAPLSP